MTNKAICGLSLSLLLTVLVYLCEEAEGRRMSVGSCPVTVHPRELRRYYTELRQSALAEDNEIAVRLLNRPLMKDIQEGEMCCYLRLLLRFYVERVFSGYRLSQARHQRSASVLANSFLGIKKDLKLCHCQCGEETQRSLDSLHVEFGKLDIKQAVNKAVGELDTLLGWLEGSDH